MDYKGLNEQMTSSTVATDRCYNFRQDVMQRDGSHCIITHEFEEICDAAHLIPRHKGNEVIFIIVLLYVID